MSDKNVTGGAASTRRTVILGAAVVAAAPLLAGEAHAAGTVPQKTAQYQPTPKGAAQCSKCNYFLPGKDPKGPGACKQVAGVIAPTGWCIFFAAKHA
jgi:hypothetical protein